ncbi:MAG: hypothetical protein ACOY3J_00135 [Bacillota bacterium]
MTEKNYRIAAKCPHFESIRSSGGWEAGSIDTKSYMPSCEHCVNWFGGSCDLFLARG